MPHFRTINKTMAVNQGLQEEQFNELLRTLLGDAVVQLTAPAQIASQKSSADEQLRCEQDWQAAISGQGTPQGSAQGSSSAANVANREEVRRQDSKKAGSSSDRRGTRGVRRQVLRLEQSLNQQQVELKQQQHRKVYLAERVAILEQLIYLREMHEKRAAQLQTGLSYNPFAAWGLSFQESMSAKPPLIAERYNHVVQCLASRLASVTPLLQSYPQLVYHRPPVHLLQQLVKDLSLAEPTNPYGADGLPVGSFTGPVPASAILTLAAAYSMDIFSMLNINQAMLESCAVLVAEQASLTQSFLHGFLRPEFANSSAVHLDELAMTRSWEALATSLSRVSVGTSDAPNHSKRADVRATIADEAHWRNVVSTLCLTDKQKLEASILWEIVQAGKAAIIAHRAQLAGQLTQLASPGLIAQAVRSASAAESTLHAATALQQQGMQPGEGLRRAYSAQESATAVYGLSPEDLTQREVLMQRLENTIARERSLMSLSGIMLYGSILSPVQMTKAVVHSYPYMKGHMEILSACAAECTPAVIDALASTVGSSTGA